MKLERTRYGLTLDGEGVSLNGLRQLQVKLEWQGRTLLGDVKGAYTDPVSGSLKLKVHHFNGEEWPIDPVAVVVDVLERRALEVGR